MFILLVTKQLNATQAHSPLAPPDCLKSLGESRKVCTPIRGDNEFSILTGGTFKTVSPFETSASSAHRWLRDCIDLQLKVSQKPRALRLAQRPGLWFQLVAEPVEATREAQGTVGIFKERLFDDTEFLADFDEGGDGFVEVLALVGG